MPAPTRTAEYGWRFLTSHAQVLLYVAANPSTRVRDIGYDLDLTERHVYGILRDLEQGGYISRKREGRRSQITINQSKQLRSPVAERTTIRQLLTLLDATGG
jgi:DNA-binding MarR family transcriptional regulator